MLLELDDVKTYLGISGTTYDTLLTMLIELTQGEVEAILDRKLEQQTITDEILEYGVETPSAFYNPVLAGNDRYPRLFLANYPASSLTLKYDSDTVDTDNYRLDGDTGILVLYTYKNDQKGKITADYTAGYTSSTLPQGLKSLMLNGVREAFEASGTSKQKGEKVTSKKVGDFSVSYGEKAMKAYLQENTSILNRYTRVVL